MSGFHGRFSAEKVTGDRGEVRLAKGVARVRQDTRFHAQAREHGFVDQFGPQDESKSERRNARESWSTHLMSEDPREISVRDRLGGHEVDRPTQVVVDDPQHGADLIAKRDGADPLVT